LHGSCALIPLPLLETMLPGNSAQAASGDSQDGQIPIRLGFCEHTFGVWPDRWFPKEPGRDYAISDAFAPLAKPREHFTIFGGLENAGHRDDAHHAMESFLCCSKTDADPTKSISYSVTADQIAANQIGHGTRFPTMILGSYKSPLYGTRSCSLSKTDQDAVEKMVNTLRSRGNGLRDLVHLITQSELFRRK
jgi:hypothetical protein